MEHSRLSENKSTDNPLFAFAGIDGAGKTTLINGLSSELRIKGYNVFISKAYTQEHKDAFHSFVSTADDVEMMFMFQAFQRRQRNDALAKLALGSIVLADRWNESYEAFHSQNGALSEDENLRAQIDYLAFEALVPHKTIYLRTKPTVAMRRTHERGADFFDAKAVSYHQEQASFYDKCSEEDPNWITLDGHLPQSELVAQTLEIIEDTTPVIGIAKQQLA